MTEHDEAQQRPRPAVRQTVQQQVDALRDELNAYESAITDKVATLRAEIQRAAPSPDVGDVQALVHETMRPIVDKANSTHTAMLARVEELERISAVIQDGQEAARVWMAERGDGPAGGEGYATQLQVRIGKLEEQVKAQPAANAAINTALGNAAEALRRIAALEDRPASDVDGTLSRLGERLGVLERRVSSGEIVQQALTAPVPLVHARVLELMKRVTSIGKDKVADAGTGGRFKFRGIDAAMDAVGHGMREVGLVLETAVLATDYATNPVTKPDRDGNPYTILWTTARVTVRYTFICPEDGSRHVFEMAGEGRDASDKATSKAASMACKYALFQALMIPVEGLDESDGENPQITQERATLPVAPPYDPQVAGQGGATSPSAPGPAQDENRQREYSKAELAKAAKDALDRIGRLHPDQRHAELVRIQNKVVAAGLASHEIDGATLQAHAIAVMHTLGAQPGGEPGTGF
jgi:hypothetical protein